MRAGGPNPWGVRFGDCLAARVASSYVRFDLRPVILDAICLGRVRLELADSRNLNCRHTGTPVRFASRGSAEPGQIKRGSLLVVSEPPLRFLLGARSYLRCFRRKLQVGQGD